MAISDFQNFWDCDPQNFKNKFFWEKCSKIQNFQNSQKNVLYLLESSQHAKFQIPISMFDPQMTTQCEMWWRHQNKSHFWDIYRHLTQKQITP